MSSAIIVCGDGFAALRGAAPGSVDHVITDPPYTARSTRARTNKRSAAATGTGGDAGVTFAWDGAALREFRDLAVRVARRWVIIFCELESLGLFAESPAFVRSGIWDRHSTPQITGDRPAQPAEGIAFLHAGTGTPTGAAEPSVHDCPECRARGEHPLALAILHREGAKRWNGGGKRGVWRHPVVRGAGRAHPAQKPGGLALDLVQDFTDPGDTILDPCCGVGTIPIVAAGAGRTGVGYELDARWAAMAQARARGDAAWTEVPS